MAFIHKGLEVKRVALIGFGRSNRGVYEYLKNTDREISFTVRGDKPSPVPHGALAYFGSEQFKDLTEDICFVTPGIRSDIPALRGAHTSSDAELFFEKTRGTVFGITGTDGKSTTTALTKILLEPSFEKVHAVGNIGEPFSPHLFDTGRVAYAAELSSFQLMDLTPATRRATLTNIKPSHLNWHKSLGEYICAKKRIFERTEEAVLPLDSPLLSEHIRIREPFAVFSTELCESDILKKKAEHAFYLKGGSLFLDGAPLLSLSRIRRREDYNIKNFMAALALSYGFWDEGSLGRAADFTGLPHRLEPVCTRSGFPCYNSSIDTSPDRTAATLAGFVGGYILLAGGRTKNSDFEILRPILQKNAYAAVLTGENRKEIGDAIAASVPLYFEEDFEPAVRLALGLAVGRGLPLVFSPASTSFDSHASFEARGEEFKRIIMSV